MSSDAGPVVAVAPTPSTPRPLVVYLAGDRELHAPELTIGVQGDLATKLAAAENMPIADPPASRPAAVATGAVQLLRLDRLVQELAAFGLDGPYEFVFVLTQQDDVNYRNRDTAQLSPLLQRWCSSRDFGYDELIVTGRPHQLDGAGAELLHQLDVTLAHAAGPVVLVAGGGPPALQTSAHFATFRGVRHRDQLVVVQLEEVVERSAEPQEDLDNAPARRPRIVDSNVRVVERFHGVVGRRTILGQARDLLDELDLPGAAQLLRAAGSDVADAEQSRLSERILHGLTRSIPADDALGALSHALDLAEIEWSRPGGSHLEAIWYASLASIDLLPDARSDYAGLPKELTIPEERIRVFNDMAGPKEASDQFSALRMSSMAVRTKAARLLCDGPARLDLPGRTVDVSALCGEHFRGKDPAPGTIWAALVVAYKPSRNEGAHSLMTGTRQDAERTVRTTSQVFTYAAAVLSGVPEAYRLCPVADERLDEVQVAVSGTDRRGGGTNWRARQLSKAVAAGPAVLVEHIANEGTWASNFADLSKDERRQVLDVIDALREGPGEEARKLQLQLFGGEPEGLGPLGLAVSMDRSSSSFRQLCRTLVPNLPDRNQLLEDVRELQSTLDRSVVAG